MKPVRSVTDAVAEIQYHVDSLRALLDRVVPAFGHAVEAGFDDERAWDLAKIAADINEGGELRMHVVELQAVLVALRSGRRP